MSVDDAPAEDEDASWWPRATPIAVTPTSSAARRSFRIRRVGVRAYVRSATPPAWMAWCCRHVSGFRYAGDTRPL